MLEILFLIWFAKKLGRMAEAKERTKAWGALGVILWIGGELSGALFAASGRGDTGAIYATALGCAAIGALIAYIVVASLKPPPPIPPARVV